MNANTRICQRGCIVFEELNWMIEKMLKYALKGRDDRFHVYDALSVLQMNAVVHRARELFLTELVLVDVRSVHRNGVIVVGDLNGSFEDLIGIISRYGLPPDKYYVFLGNFVNVEKRRTDISRPNDSLSTVLFIFLLKLRYPSHVTVLRGNHEVYDNNYCSRFSKQCEEYGLGWLHKRINEAFDELPLSCTLDGYFLAHGGPSQFAQSKGWLKDVVKPVKRDDVVESLVFNDLINADLNTEQTHSHSHCFHPNLRTYGFDYSSKSLSVLLDAFMCHSMVSGKHAQKYGGSVMTIDDDTWFYSISSLHQINLNGVKESSVLSLPENLISTVTIDDNLSRGIYQLLDQIKNAGDHCFHDRHNLETTEFPPIPDYVELYEATFENRINSNCELVEYFEGVAGRLIGRLRKVDKYNAVQRDTSEYIPLVLDISKRVITRLCASEWEKRLFLMYMNRYSNRLLYSIPDKRHFTTERHEISPAKKTAFKILDFVCGA